MRVEDEQGRHDTEQGGASTDDQTPTAARAHETHVNEKERRADGGDLRRQRGGVVSQKDCGLRAHVRSAERATQPGREQQARQQGDDPKLQGPNQRQDRDRQGRRGWGAQRRARAASALNPGFELRFRLDLRLLLCVGQALVLVRGPRFVHPVSCFPVRLVGGAVRRAGAPGSGPYR